MQTLVLGASLKPERYSNQAILRLRDNELAVSAIGLREGTVTDVNIQTGLPDLKNIHTITMYLNAKRQVQYYEYIFALKPIRIIFNPGAENPELSELAKAQGIIVENACTLVMLNLGIYENVRFVNPDKM